ncbi:MAG: hypothetical protein K0Q49_1312 [Haloplasmataceae bacterium]|jgi:hypothetical protein|nr:hypothetical protein [Haloplasmataceae bacterium]
MDPINSQILELIETEIQQCNQEEYHKVIPIEQYNFETKRALDKLVEKYGGLVKRYDDKVTLFILVKNQKKVEKHTEKSSQEPLRNFDELNIVIDRLAKIEIKINDLMETQNVTLETNKRFTSYMNYFKLSKEGQTLKTLVEEILNHH